MEGRKKGKVRVLLSLLPWVTYAAVTVCSVASHMPNKPTVILASGPIFFPLADVIVASCWSQFLHCFIIPSLISVSYSQSPGLNSLCCKHLRRCLFSCTDPDWFTRPALALQAFAYALSQHPYPRGHFLVILKHFIRPSPPLWSHLSFSRYLFLRVQLGFMLLHIFLTMSGLFLQTPTDLIFLRGRILLY